MVATTADAMLFLVTYDFDITKKVKSVTLSRFHYIWQHFESGVFKSDMFRRPFRCQTQFLQFRYAKLSYMCDGDSSTNPLLELQVGDLSGYSSNYFNRL